MQHKRLLAFCALWLVAFGLRAQTLVLHHADGTTTDVELFTQPTVQFVNDKVVIASTVLSMEYPKEQVVRFTYRGSTLGVQAPKAEADYSREADRLVFHGIKATDCVAVYKPNGIRVPVRIALNGTDAVLPLSQIPQGVYLLSVNGRTSKFTKP
ncbi:MAG: hypothetical protein IJ841_04895 [Prevotella sp.]|nr:hypothetical protein [Prevotella sp.]